jgi:hypothetical protein
MRRQHVGRRGHPAILGGSCPAGARLRAPPPCSHCARVQARAQRLQRRQAGQLPTDATTVLGQPAYIQGQPPLHNSSLPPPPRQGPRGRTPWHAAAGGPWRRPLAARHAAHHHPHAAVVPRSSTGHSPTAGHSSSAPQFRQPPHSLTGPTGYGSADNMHVTESSARPRRRQPPAPGRCPLKHQHVHPSCTQDIPAPPPAQHSHDAANTGAKFRSSAPAAERTHPIGERPPPTKWPACSGKQVHNTPPRRLRLRANYAPLPDSKGRTKMNACQTRRTLSQRPKTPYVLFVGAPCRADKILPASQPPPTTAACSTELASADDDPAPSCLTSLVTTPPSHSPHILEQAPLSTSSHRHPARRRPSAGPYKRWDCSGKQWRKLHGLCRAGKDSHHCTTLSLCGRSLPLNPAAKHWKRRGLGANTRCSKGRGRRGRCGMSQQQRFVMHL